MNETLNVLLIEDNEAEAALVQELLHGLRPPAYQVRHFERLAAALAHLDVMAPDVVLLDLKLPDSSGTIGVKSLRARRAGMPIIVLTNLSDEDVAVECVREGAQDYLIKREIDARSLSRAIRYAMERAREEEALRVSEERYTLALRGANDGIWDWDLIHDKAYFSPRWKEILGFERGALGDSIDEWFGRINDEDRAGFRTALSAHLDGKMEHFEHEHRVRTRQGDDLWVLCRGASVRDHDGQACRIAGSLSDISQRKRVETQLVHDALHDALTRLPNRGLFMDRLDLALKRFRRNGERLFAVLFFDLDRFKSINDSLGHTVGDELLVQVARRVERILRPGDTLARLGGDEFAILINDVSESYHATYVANRVHELLGEVVMVYDHEIHTSASIGIALSDREYKRPEEILRDADLAMYRAKTSGHARYEVFDSTMHESALAKHRLEMDLRRAVENGELVLHYQPIVSLESDRIAGFEALLRWRHPQWGLVTPDYFIDVAEETGLIVPIGWWVLEESSAQAKRWQEMFPMDPPLSMSVNVSGKLLARPEIQRRLEHILRLNSLSPGTLRLEITEGAIMNQASEVLETLNDLRGMGIQLHIDDFGTGYSSLSHLQKFTCDSLKIDKSFVSRIGGEREGNAIVGAIIALGHSLGIKVIAEGVETLRQLETLRDLKCPEAQGFWFSRPMDQKAIGAFMLESADLH